VINVRLLGGAPTVDVRFRAAPAKLSHWISAVVVLIAAAAVAFGLILAAFGLFAALRIAHSYGSSVERASAAVAFAPGAWQRQPNDGADRLAPAPIAPPVVARSDPAETDIGLETGSIRSQPPAGHAEPGVIAEDNERGPTRPAASITPRWRRRLATARWHRRRRPSGILRSSAMWFASAFAALPAVRPTRVLLRVHSSRCSALHKQLFTVRSGSSALPEHGSVARDAPRRNRDTACDLDGINQSGRFGSRTYRGRGKCPIDTESGSPTAGGDTSGTDLPEPCGAAQH